MYASHEARPPQCDRWPITKLGNHHTGTSNQNSSQPYDDRDGEWPSRSPGALWGIAHSPNLPSCFLSLFRGRRNESVQGAAEAKSCRCRAWSSTCPEAWQRLSKPRRGRTANGWCVCGTSTEEVSVFGRDSAAQGIILAVPRGRTDEDHEGREACLGAIELLLATVVGPQLVSTLCDRPRVTREKRESPRRAGGTL